MTLPPKDSGQIELEPGSDLQYQGTVRFDYEYPGRLSNPRVYVEAFQDGTLVYGEAGGAGDTFLLGGGMSRWVMAGGGPADCTATLFYFARNDGKSEWRGSGQQEYVELAKTKFHVEA